MGELSVFIGSFLSVPIFTADVEFSKNANSATAVGSYTHIVVFVWRQLELAFFGAVTPVAALFVLKGGEYAVWNLWAQKKLLKS